MKLLDEYISKVRTLPPAPQVLPQLMSLLNEDNTDSAKIVGLIRIDPALTAKVLQRCNNAALGFAHPVADLEEAVTRVGFNEIYRLVALVIGEGMLGAPQRGYGIATGELWQHSVTTAVAARTVASKLGADENLVFTAALLHDIGKLVLSGFLEAAYEPVLRETGPAGHSFLEAEKSILGVEHAEVGGRVLAQWRFPASLVAAVWRHHDPAQAGPHARLAALVHLGDIIAHCLGQAQGLQSFAVRSRAEALEILEITPREIETFIIESSSALEESGLATHARS